MIYSIIKQIELRALAFTGNLDVKPIGYNGKPLCLPCWKGVINGEFITVSTWRIPFFAKYSL